MWIVKAHCKSLSTSGFFTLLRFYVKNFKIKHIGKKMNTEPGLSELISLSSGTLRDILQKLL